MSQTNSKRYSKMPQDFCERLLAIRHEKGWSQEEMALKTGVSMRQYCGYEYGENSPSTKFLVSLAGFGIDLMYLLLGQHTPQTLVLSDMLQWLIFCYQNATPNGQAAMEAVATLSNDAVHCAAQLQGRPLPQIIAMPVRMDQEVYTETEKEVIAKLRNMPENTKKLIHAVLEISESSHEKKIS